MTQKNANSQYMNSTVFKKNECVQLLKSDMNLACNLQQSLLSSIGGIHCFQRLCGQFLRQVRALGSFREEVLQWDHFSIRRHLEMF